MDAKPKDRMLDRGLNNSYFTKRYRPNKIEKHRKREGISQTRGRNAAGNSKEPSPPLDQLAKCKPTMKSTKNNMQQPERKPHGQGRKQIVTGEKINSYISNKKSKDNQAPPRRPGEEKATLLNKKKKHSAILDLTPYPDSVQHTVGSLAMRLDTCTDTKFIEHI
jgi:hypothetical protein